MDYNVWDYFTRINKSSTDASNVKKSRCRLCQNILKHSTTTHNLKLHLLKKHNVEMPKGMRRRREIKLGNESDFESSQKPSTARERSEMGSVWKYYKKIVGSDRMAECCYCKKPFSYKSSTGNLKTHLLRVHGAGKTKANSNSSSSIHTDPDAEFLDDDGFDASDTNSEPRVETEQVVELDKFFTSVDGVDGTARCELCSATVDYNSDAFEAHLRDEHSKISKPSNNESDAEEPQFNQEVVFLYESDAEKASKAANKPSISPYSQQEREREKQERERERERERQLEERREERRKERLRRRERMRQTVRRSVHEERSSVADAEELENFGKYVTCLMRTVPKELSAQLQMDIINLIMTAKIKNMSKPEPSATDNVQTVQIKERFEPVTRASYVQQPIILSYDSSVVNGAVERSDTAGNTNSMPVISDGNQAV